MLPTAGLDILIFALASVAASPAQARGDVVVLGEVQAVRLQSKTPEVGGTYSTILKLKGHERIYRTEGKTEFVAPLLVAGDRVRFMTDGGGRVIGLEKVSVR